MLMLLNGDNEGLLWYRLC